MKRIVSLLLCLMLILPALPLSVSAAEEAPSASTAQITDREALLETPVEVTGEEAETDAFADAAEDHDLKSSSSNLNKGYWYNTLNTRQKSVYDVMASYSPNTLRSMARRNSEGRWQITLELRTSGFAGTTISGKLGSGNFFTSSAWVGIFSDLVAATSAVKRDNPQALYYESFSYSYTYRQYANYATITSVLINVILDMDGAEFTYSTQLISGAKQIAARANTYSDRYSKVKYVHDALCNGSDYNYAHLAHCDGVDHNNVVLKMPHCPYSAMFTGDEFEPVCEGYAEAFKIVLDQMGIPCVLAESEDHMWNNVQMDDGLWYNVDLTWDDYTGGYYWKYFLIGSQTVVNGKTFATEPSHVEITVYEYVRRHETSRNMPAMPNIKYPTKSKTDYVYIGRDYPQPTFSDVPRGVWYFNAVENAAAVGLFSGYSNGTFNPTGNITRAEFAKVLANAFGADLTYYGGSYFSDVPAGRWYSPAIAWVKQMGFMNGDTAGTFRPNDPITRQEMCVVLKNVLGLRSVSSAQFVDDASISSWARDSVYACRAAGLVSGYDDGTFKPKDKTQRCAAATVFMKVLPLI